MAKPALSSRKVVRTAESGSATGTWRPPTVSAKPSLRIKPPTGASLKIPSSKSIRPSKRGAAVSRRTKTSDRSTAGRLSTDKPLAADRPTAVGLSLSKKLSLCITFVTIVVTGASGLIIAWRTKHHLSNEIMKTGIATVKLYANFGQDLVHRSYTGHEEQGDDFVKEVKNNVKDLKFTDILENEFPELESTFIDAKLVVWDSKQTHPRVILSIAKGAGSESFTGITLQKVEKKGIEIQAARRRQGDSEQLVYVFLKDFPLDLAPTDEAGTRYRPERAQAIVYLSTAKIDESLAEVYQYTAGIIVIASLISLLVALVLSYMINQPMALLAQDMKVVTQGDLDHITMPHSTDEVGYLASSFNELTQKLKLARANEIEQAKIKHELEVGREIQQILLPKANPKIPGYDLDAFYLAANELGGDYYDFVVVDKTHLAVVVADVAGKGIPASIYMTIMRTILNIAAVNNPSCVKALISTNRLLSDRIKRGMFVTCFYAILDARNHILRLSSAGHNPMLLYRAAGRMLEEYNPPGIALGFDKGPLFQRTLKEAETKLFPGDRFVLYTDGVVESMNENREEFGDRRLKEFMLKYAGLESKVFVQNWWRL